MTRRGRDRYKPADLRRGIVRDGGSWPTRRAPSALRRVGHLAYAPVSCRRHDVPWLDCTMCSTTRSATP